MNGLSELYRYTFELAELARTHPPRFTDPNKLLFFRLTGGDQPLNGMVEVSRWRTAGLPAERSSHRPQLSVHSGYFTYDTPNSAQRRHWHLNFANYDLFSSYAGPLLAQDEMQVLEHPDLASVRLALRAHGASTLVVEQEEPTPILVVGVPRRGVIDTAPATDRPAGLYGNRFARASAQQVEAATTRLDPPTRSNIVAIEAPAGGIGVYSAHTISFILQTAIAGFGAAVAETARVTPGAATTIHTGWWGCGAYGGNQELMALLQLLAAEWAGVEELAFHTGGTGENILARAQELAGGFDELNTAELIETIAARGYRWGVSDGN